MSDLELFIADTFGPLAVLTAGAAVAWILAIQVIGIISELFSPEGG
jgi:hypothetical protein